MIYVVSDIHGCYDKYIDLLNLINLSSDDTLYVLGDMIDRGSSGIKIIEHIMQNENIIPIAGNHEYSARICLPFLIDDMGETDMDNLDDEQFAELNLWLRNGAAPTLRGLGDMPREMRLEILVYLNSLTYYKEVYAGGKSFLLTHTFPQNYKPEKPLSDYDPKDFIYGRPDYSAPDIEGKICVFGHTPVQVINGAGKIYRNKNMIDIDCGCAYEGGKLACLCLNTLDEYYV